MSSDIKKPGNTDKPAPVVLYSEYLHDENAEKAVLSALLLADMSSRIYDVRQEYFYGSKNKLIFQTMQKLYESGRPIDIITLLNQMSADKKADGEMVAHLNDINGFVLSGGLFDNHLKVIKDKSAARSLVGSFNDAFVKLLNGGAINEAASGVFGEVINLYRNSSEGLIEDLGVAGTRVMKLYEELISGDGFLAKTGYHDLDRLLGTMGRTGLVILGGRPGMGKSVMAANMILKNVLNNVPVGLINYEMSTEDTTIRMLSNVARLPFTSLMRSIDRTNEEQIIKTGGQLAGAIKRIEALPFYQIDGANGTLYDLKANIVQLVKVKNCRIVFVDYLQLVSVPGHDDNKNFAIGQITRAMKLLAKELNIVIVLLSQLNRSLDQRKDKRPQLSDLRESGNIEQDADIVMFVYRDEYYTKEQTNKPGILEIIAAKNRNGRVGSIELYYEEELSLVGSLTRDNV